MHVRDGYKMTELGEIPMEWKILPLSHITASKEGLRRGPFGGALKKEIFISQGYPVYEQQHAIYCNFNNFRYYVSDNKFKEMHAFLVKDGDILISCSGTIGRVAKVPPGAPKGIMNQALLRIRVTKEMISTDFLTILIGNKTYQDMITGMTHGSAMKNIVGMETMKNILFPVPPLPEQQKIADILSTIDEHISQTESLIEKTKVLKQGMMQQLLTKGIGHTAFKDTEIGRIPVEWEVVSVGECFSISGGVAVSRAGLGDFGIKYLHYGDIHVKNQLVFDVKKDAFWISKVDPATIVEKKDSLLQTGDIVFADASEDYEGIGKSVVINNQAGEKYLSGLHTIVAKSLNDELEYSYRKYMLSTSNVRKQFVFYAAGASVYGISKKNIALIKFAKPLFTEQQKIASILTSIDDQINDYQTKLTSLAKLKSALMQQLLTGKTRVKI